MYVCMYACMYMSCFSCYFSSSDNITPSTIEQPIYNLDLRKVVQYTYSPISGDTSDEDSGHGRRYMINFYSLL